MSRLIYIYEYNNLIAQIRTDSLPALQKVHVGWRVNASDGVQINEAKVKTFVKDLGRFWTRIEHDYPGTPWAIVAGREKNVVMRHDLDADAGMTSADLFDIGDSRDTGCRRNAARGLPVRDRVHCTLSSPPRPDWHSRQPKPGSASSIRTAIRFRPSPRCGWGRSLSGIASGSEPSPSLRTASRSRRPTAITSTSGSSPATQGRGVLPIIGPRVGDPQLVVSGRRVFSRWLASPGVRRHPAVRIPGSLADQSRVRLGREEQEVPAGGEPDERERLLLLRRQRHVRHRREIAGHVLGRHDCAQGRRRLVVSRTGKFPPDHRLRAWPARSWSPTMPARLASESSASRAKRVGSFEGLNIGASPHRPRASSSRSAGALAFASGMRRLASRRLVGALRIGRLVAAVSFVGWFADGVAARVGAWAGRRRIEIWEVPAVWKKRLRDFTLPVKAPGSIAFSPDGKVLRAGRRARVLSFWDSATGKRLLTFPDPSTGQAAASQARSRWDPITRDCVLAGRRSAGVVRPGRFDSRVEPDQRRRDSPAIDGRFAAGPHMVGRRRDVGGCRFLDAGRFVERRANLGRIDRRSRAANDRRRIRSGPSRSVGRTASSSSCSPSEANKTCGLTDRVRQVARPIRSHRNAVRGFAALFREGRSRGRRLRDKDKRTARRDPRRSGRPGRPNRRDRKRSCCDRRADPGITLAPETTGCLGHFAPEEVALGGGV